MKLTSTTQFDSARIDQMLAPENSQRVMDRLVGFVQTNQYAGLQIDFELLTIADDRDDAHAIGAGRRDQGVGRRAGLRVPVRREDVPTIRPHLDPGRINVGQVLGVAYEGIQRSVFPRREPGACDGGVLSDCNRLFAAILDRDVAQ